jgi:hypothetical protein
LPVSENGGNYFRCNRKSGCADISSCKLGAFSSLWKSVSKTLANFVLQLELLPPIEESRKSNKFNQKEGRKR